MQLVSAGVRERNLVLVKKTHLPVRRTGPSGCGSRSAAFQLQQSCSQKVNQWVYNITRLRIGNPRKDWEKGVGGSLIVFHGRLPGIVRLFWVYVAGFQELSGSFGCGRQKITIIIRASPSSRHFHSRADAIQNTTSTGKRVYSFFVFPKTLLLHLVSHPITYI